MKETFSNKKLILHFDARNTLFAADFNSKLTTEQALNTYMSGLAWGIINDNKWKMTIPDIVTNQWDKNLVSYYKFMEKVIVRTPDDRPILREKLGRFTQQEGKKFEPIFYEHLELLKWPSEKEMVKDLIVHGDSGTAFHYILPTFFHLLEHLHDNQRDFAIIIRTYGRDIPYILRAIQVFLDGKHPDFPRKLNIKINMKSDSHLCMSKTTNQFVYTSKDPECQLETDAAIYDYWNSLDGIIACRDDFRYWLDHDYHYKSSKPLWVNHQSPYRSNKNDDRIYHHIFFDDSIRPMDIDSIVHLRRLVPESGDMHNGSEILSVEETIQLMDINIVQSDLLKCIKNKHYFKEKLELCEKNFDKSMHI